MTTLAEREKIERNATSATLPSDSTQGEYDAAQALIRKLKAGVIEVASAQLNGTAPASGPERSAVVWAREVLRNPDGWTVIVLRVLLADNAQATPAQIAGVSDAAIITAITAKVPDFALGLRA